MKIFPARLTTRRTMVWVAIVGLSISVSINGPGWVKRRKNDFLLLSLTHQTAGEDVISIDSPRHERRRQWHRLLGERYRFAYNWPLLPVWPDPPEPE